ncbi:SlyX family protein [Marinobacter halodurans]|uniref:Protein SlyX homolog n=1 Tax=Marinobacter halodurans TaxID=2528979 RepID=A0ABY1ZLJ3_9GAMM|nr:SlyX family protein [Marinobacter halodurans]TBW56690.1 SlyX family protein [Marinobacter halodurans]
MNWEELEVRMVELETRVAFQDDLIATLSDQLSRQERDMRELWEAKRLLKKQLEAVSPSNIKREEEEAPPPHY